jgi:hypothetical protein
VNSKSVGDFSMAGKTLLIIALLLSSVSFSATAKSDHYAFEHGITGYTPAQFARLCIKCQAQAMGKGRSVMGYCPGDCGDVYANEICEQGEAMHCRPGPEPQLQAAGPVVPAKQAPAAAKASVAAPSVAQVVKNPWDWSAQEEKTSVNATGLAVDRLSHFRLGCDADKHTVGFIFDADGYRGRSFTETSRFDQSIIFDIQQKSGVSQKFPLLATPTGDGDWMLKNDLTGDQATAFLDSFGQEGRLSFQTARGVELASWTLKGTSQTRETMRKVCNL